MAYRDVPGDRQAQTGATVAAIAGFVDTREPFENLFPVGVRDAGAVVADLHPDHARLGLRDGHGDAVARVPGGVVQKVAQHSGQFLLAPDHQRGRIGHHDEPLVRRHPIAPLAGQFLRDRGEIDRLPASRRRAFQAREQQQVVGEPLQPLGAGAQHLRVDSTAVRGGDLGDAAQAC